MNSVTLDVFFHFVLTVSEKIVDNVTSYPGPFLEFFKHKNYSGKNTFSFEHREESGRILPLL